MKKTTLLLFSLLTIAGFSQQKSTGDMQLNNSIPITANFTLDNSTSKVTLVLKGPSDRWFGLGIGIVQGFGMSDGDAVVFTTNTTPNVTDRNYQGAFEPPQDASQDWTIESNTVAAGVRTLTLKRNLTNSDSNDYQFPYATTNTITIGGVRSQTTNDFTLAGGHGGAAAAGFASGTFTPLGVEDFSLNASKVYPNPSNGTFTVETKTALERINIYSQTGAFVRSVDVKLLNSGETNVHGLATGVYLLELVNSTEKSWKKLIVK